MPPKKHIKSAARALREHAMRAAEYRMADQRGPHYATVLEVDPISAEVHDLNLLLEDEDLSLCQQVRFYHEQFGIDEGDTLLVHEMGDGDWVATAVLSDKDVSA